MRRDALTKQKIIGVRRFMLCTTGQSNHRYSLDSVSMVQHNYYDCTLQNIYVLLLISEIMRGEILGIIIMMIVIIINVLILELSADINV